MSPFPKKNTIPCTPMTKAMELYNWLNEMTKHYKSKEVKNLSFYLFFLILIFFFFNIKLDFELRNPIFRPILH